MNEYIEDWTRTLPAPGTSATESFAKTMSDFPEHIWEVEHVGGATPDALVEFWVGAHRCSM